MRSPVAIGGGEMLVVLRRLDGSHYGAAFTLPDGNESENPSARRAVSLTQGSEMQEGLKTLPYKFSGLAIDAAGNIFVAAPDANIIEKLDAKTLRLETIAGDGHRGSSGDGGAPLAAEFNAPGALTIDRDGSLFVADTGNLAIREITHAAAVAGVTLSPNTFTFPNEPTGGASAAEAFTLTNNSAVQVTGIAIDFTGGATPPDFTETSTCATTLDAGASCTISVVFMPQSAGERSAALHVTDSDPSSPQTAALAGFADDYELGLQSGNTDTLTVIPGATANYNLAVVPESTFSGTVTIDCPVNLPAETTCGLAAGTSSSSSGGSSGASGPTSLDLNVSPGAPQNFTMALVTTAKGPAGKSVAMERKWPQFPAPGAGIVVLAAMAMGFVGWRWAKYREGLKSLPYGGAGGACSCCGHNRFCGGGLWQRGHGYVEKEARSGDAYGNLQVECARPFARRFAGIYGYLDRDAVIRKSNSKHNLRSRSEGEALQTIPGFELRPRAINQQPKAIDTSAEPEGYERRKPSSPRRPPTKSKARPEFAQAGPRFFVRKKS